MTRRQVCGHTAPNLVLWYRPASRLSWSRSSDFWVSVRWSPPPSFFCHPQPEPRHATRNKLPWTTSWQPECWPPNALLGRSTSRKLARGLHNLISSPLTGRRAGATPTSLTSAYPTMAVFYLGCQRRAPVQRQRKLSDPMGGSGETG